MRMLPHLESVSEREARWLRGATKLGTRIGSGFGDVHALGRLDCSLRKSVEDLLEVFRTSTPGTEGGGMTDFLYLSKLWVFGAYETARTLDQTLRHRQPPHPCKERVHQLKLHLERVRIPLAKLEAASRFPGDAMTGSRIVSRDDGFSWEVGQGVLVKRDELADEFLSVLDCFPDPTLPDGSAHTRT